MKEHFVESLTKVTILHMSSQGSNKFTNQFIGMASLHVKFFVGDYHWGFWNVVFFCELNELRIRLFHGSDGCNKVSDELVGSWTTHAKAMVIKINNSFLDPPTCHKYVYYAIG